jgi:hypothetical protein
MTDPDPNPVRNTDPSQNITYPDETLLCQLNQPLKPKAKARKEIL